MIRRTRLLTSLPLLLLTSALSVPATQAADLPKAPECIAPANPGGGWDFTCRTVGQLLSTLSYVKGNVQTVNMPGASGGVAYANIVSKRNSDPNVVVAASTATTTRLAQGQFPGMNAEMVKWVGALGADYGVIAVGKNSPYQDLKQLMAALQTDPNSVKFAGGSASGGWDHLKVLLAAKAAGVSGLAKIKYLAFNGGGEAMTQVLGGHIDAFTGDVSEVLGFMQSGDLRVLAVLSDKRLPAPYDTLPTAAEQGIDTVAPNWRGFYIPGGVSDQEYQWWTATLDSLYASPAWKQTMAENGLMPFHKVGADFDGFVKQQISQITDLSREIGLIK
ncbi:C4-dicarboxylate ABC transporter substrate-binding protein [Pokkaliibacter plantistimulans]|uniref:C4-dicarboxylate ABC transporter substrate-binding protein n=1 Tax=Pokkaliibacter plantistimulans TaxID=1635171 RepID=A0ABX5M5P0_9GAMM|nr:tripartite tricarboxylate transporter substrate-binding protein [Pokkaliibacter plantistimulans]PXF33038.1 C4-dicarboxylate ABC transporter substrate-binding protein [Pokkaliibacter plantistimulans]